MDGDQHHVRTPRGIALVPVSVTLQHAIQATVDGVPVLECHYGTSNGKYALKIDQLLTSSNTGWLGESHV